MGARFLDSFTIDELIAVCISRQVCDGEIWAQGINTPLVMAGLILAKCTHAPQLRFVSAIGQSICNDWSPLGVTNIEDMWLRKSLIHIGFATAAADMLPRYHPKEFLRPAQVDAKGNYNNIAFGRNYHQPRMRLPGTGGIPDVSTSVNDSFLYVPRHSRIVFQETIDFISGLGHEAHRVRGKGPRYLISDLGQFDWHDRRMRLTSVHPHTTLEHVQKKTGFDLEIAPNIEPTQVPSAEEIQLLREEIDPLGVRKLELLAGNARKQLLQDIITAEKQVNNERGK